MSKKKIVKKLANFLALKFAQITEFVEKKGLENCSL